MEEVSTNPARILFKASTLLISNIPLATETHMTKFNISEVRNYTPPTMGWKIRQGQKKNREMLGNSKFTNSGKLDT